MNIEQFLTDKVAAAVSTLYGNAGAPLQIQKTRKEFEGDYTLVVFPCSKPRRQVAASHGDGDRRIPGGQYAGNQGVQP